jgi:hypothetical protein
VAIPVPAQPKRRIAATLGAVLVVAASGCGDSASSGSSPENESRDQQGQREFRICMKQADGNAKTQGAEAAKEHMDQCVESLANGTF